MVIIGIDTHIATCDYFAIKKDGECLGEGTFKTSALSFKQIVKDISDKEKIVIIEQGPLANWIRRILSPLVTKVVVAETRRNRWIAQDTVKNDRVDSQKLATLYLGGFIKEIVQRDDKNEELLNLVMQHHDLVRNRTQMKNKLKAKFRQNGIRAAGDSVFTKSRRDEWLSQLAGNKSYLWPVESKYQQIDLLDEQLKKTDKCLLDLSRRYPIIKILQEYPGIGLINASTFVAMLDTPNRFSTVKQIWTYCGLGIDVRQSGMKAGSPRLTTRGNRLLKYTLKQSAITAARLSKDNPYKQWYTAAIAAGKPEYKALLTCARKLAKDMWLKWKAHLGEESGPKKDF